MKKWTLQTSTTFDKQFASIDKTHKLRILAFIKKRVLSSQDPKSLAKPLKGELAGYWRFRIGNYRIIADIQDEVCVIVALEIGHRREIYG